MLRQSGRVTTPDMRARAFAIVLVVVSGCGSSKEEPKPDPATTQAPTALPLGKRRAHPKGVVPELPEPAGDPRAGRFSLEDAVGGLPGKGDLVARIDTSLGVIDCRLLDATAPIAVANFVGLARGVRPSWDGAAWTARPAYDGTVFHRVKQGFMIQGGSKSANEEAGYVIPDEPGGAHDHAGQLCMANRGKDTASKQFFITDGPAPHLDGGYTIFGECGPVDVIHRIASVPVRGETPIDAPAIRSVQILRGDAAALAASAAPSASSAPSATPTGSARAHASAAPSSRPKAAPSAASAP